MKRKSNPLAVRVRFKRPQVSFDGTCLNGETIGNNMITTTCNPSGGNKMMEHGFGLSGWAGKVHLAGLPAQGGGWGLGFGPKA
jgi:hypothetical protein